MGKESIKGISETIKELRAFGKDIEKLIDAETNEIADQIQTDAKILVPKDFGKLAQSINKSKIKESNYRISVQEKYAAYVEFGTGGLVNIPKGWESLASQFRGKGIKQINIRPQPYLYPAFRKGERDYLKNLKKLLKAYKKKI
jgi:HK97 gp10 family phage protein